MSVSGPNPPQSSFGDEESNQAGGCDGVCKEREEGGRGVGGLGDDERAVIFSLAPENEWWIGILRDGCK